MADMVAKEVSEDNLGIVEAWIKSGDVDHTVDSVIPEQLGVEATHNDDAINLSAPVKCNGEVVRDFKL